MVDGKRDGRGLTKTHGMSYTKTYSVWHSMKKRCNNPTELGYKWYGARGISYDPAWEKFENFLIDMGERPEGLTLDRIDNDKGYSKNNCRWATTHIQRINQRPGIRHKHHSNNESGEKYITKVKDREYYLVNVTVDLNIKKYLGLRKSLVEAVQLRDNWLENNNKKEGSDC